LIGLQYSCRLLFTLIFEGRCTPSMLRNIEARIQLSQSHRYILWYFPLTPQAARATIRANVLFFSAATGAPH
jgi:hypothetical protein